MKVESWAKLIVERTIGREVAIHDDGSRPGMYDLRIGHHSAPEVAIECVGAVDARLTEMWNIGPARGPLSLDLRGNWHVQMLSTAQIRRLRRELESVLKLCEAEGITDYLEVDYLSRRRHRRLYEMLSDLRIESIHCYEPQGEGKVYLGIPGLGGAVDLLGRAVPAWIGEFLRASERADVLLKLERASATDCHVFVPVSFGGVPWPVMSYLGSAMKALPIAAPDLPKPVSGVWIAYGSTGIRWDGERWSYFDTRVG